MKTSVTGSAPSADTIFALIKPAGSSLRSLPQASKAMRK